MNRWFFGQRISNSLNVDILNWYNIHLIEIFIETIVDLHEVLRVYC